MSSLEDKLRATLTALAGDPVAPEDGLARAGAEARRRQRRMRRWRVAAAAAAATVAAVVVGLVIADDDGRLQVGPAAPGSTSPPDTSAATTAPFSTTAPSGVAMITGGPEQLFVTRLDDRRLFLVDADSGEELAVLDDLGDLPPEVEGMAGSGQVDLAPDGTLYYAIPSGEGIPSIWKLRPDRAAREQVVAEGSNPTVSPDGRYLAYVTTPEGIAENFARQVIVVRDLENGNEQRWTGLPNADDVPWPSFLTGLSWDPTGRRIAFSYAYGFELEESEVRILDLASDDSLGDADPLPGRLTSPAWLADGTLLAVEPLAEAVGRAPLVRFDTLASDPVRDERFAMLGVTDIDLDRNKTHILARVGFRVYVMDQNGQPRQVLTDVVGASW